MEQPSNGANGEARPTLFQIHVADEHEGGVYANFVNVWSTAFEFTIDFCATQPAIMPEGPDGPDENEPVTVPCTVVSRVRIPPTLIYEIFRALDDNLARYEKNWGPIEEPEPPEDEELEEKK